MKKIFDSFNSKLGNKGFTFIETIIVISILFLLLALIAPNFLNLQSRTSASTTVDLIITDVKNQQIKSMTGDTEGRATPDTYGVYFDTDSYTLFHGASFSQNDPDSFTVDIEDTHEISTTFPNQVIIFSAGSGEVLNFDSNNNSIVVREKSTGGSKTIRFNKYGTVIQSN